MTDPNEIEIAQLPWQPLPNGREVEVLVRHKGAPVNRTKDGRELPTIAIVWNPDLQQPEIFFDTLDFRSWNFVDAVLHFAQEIAKSQVHMAQAAYLQQQRAKAQEDAQLALRLQGQNLKRIHPGK